MNVEERDQLLKFLASLRQTPIKTKDPVAESIIRDALSQQPDALYQLVQRSMALQLTLDAALSKLQAIEAKPETAQEPLQPSNWGTGLLTQVGTLAAGTTLGVVAGGLLLDGLFDLDD
jgi:hypothetical protein